MTFAIRAHQISKEFSNGVKALKSIDLSIPAGEIFVLLGPNGSGKTTLIKSLCGLLLPSHGSTSLMGFDVVKEWKTAKSQVSLLVGEERSFYWRLSGRQNLEFFATLYGLSKQEIKKKLEQVRGLFEIDLDRRYQEYSTGMKQRLALARSFLHDAKILFMDEPTRSLDPNAADKLREIILNLRKTHPDKTFFMTSHQFQEAELLADRVGILDQGELKACGTYQELSQGHLERLEEVFRQLTLEVSDASV